MRKLALWVCLFAAGALAFSQDKPTATASSPDKDKPATVAPQANPFCAYNKEIYTGGEGNPAPVGGEGT